MKGCNYWSSVLFVDVLKFVFFNLPTVVPEDPAEHVWYKFQSGIQIQQCYFPWKGRYFYVTMNTTGPRSRDMLTYMWIELVPDPGAGCSSVGRASDRHATDSGSIPRCGRGFFSQGELSVQTLLRCPCTPSCAIACINICTHVNDPVVHVWVRWIVETLKHPAWYRLSQLVFPGEDNPNSPGEKSHWDSTDVKSKKF